MSADETKVAAVGRMVLPHETVRSMPLQPYDDNYSNAALRVGDVDHYPQRRVGEFIGIVVSNGWVNDEYKHVVLKVHEHALKALPKRIEKLQAEIAKLQSALSDPALYARDRAGFDKTAAGLHEREAALAAAEHEWLELELKREEIEGA